MKYYFIGICGISMSALAVFLKKEGNDVSGSDSNPENHILYENGISVFNKANLKKIEECDVVTFSSAIKEDNEDLKYAKHLGKKILSRGELLGVISKKYKNVIAVAGSHGKTTTTALIYNVLKMAGKNPTLHLGGILKEENSNFVIGDKEYFVTEACEYCDNFLFLKPTISVVTNIEPEHLDYFKTFENQLKSFEKFKKQSQFIFEQNGDYFAENVHYDSNGKLCFRLCSIEKNILNKKYKIKNNKNIIKKHKKTVKKSIKNAFLHKNKPILKLNKYKLKNYQEKLNLEKNCQLNFKVNICEEINIQNIIMAYRVCKFLEIPENKILEGIESFQGVKLRFEKVNCSKFPNVILDYAHHPTEIKNTMKTALKVFKDKKVVFIFQPHTYSRTKNLLNEFIDIFENLDNLILYKTYEAREKESDGISAKRLKDFLVNKDVRYCDDLDSLLKILEKFSSDDVLIFIGAGDLPNMLYNAGFIY